MLTLAPWTATTTCGRRADSSFLQRLTWSFTRASGPGGQHVNKTSSRVTLSIDAALVLGEPAAISRLQTTLGTELRVSSQTSRSQWRNRQLCLEQAARLLDEAAAPPDPLRRKSKPTRGSSSDDSKANGARARRNPAADRRSGSRHGSAVDQGASGSRTRAVVDPGDDSNSISPR